MPVQKPLISLNYEWVPLNPFELRKDPLEPVAGDNFSCQNEQGGLLEAAGSEMTALATILSAGDYFLVMAVTHGL